MLKYLLIAVLIFYLFRNYISINVNIGNGAKKKHMNSKDVDKEVQGYSDYEEIK
ncbi:MAG TPA: hypothetical protein PKD85_09670 [Saprospiraceae bacterium]|nr:hypothetical protein [Saprospiraceae bacterium]